MKKVGNVKYWKTNAKGLNISVNYTYKDILFDDEGWADASKYLPADYDLVYIRTDKWKTLAGWSTGNSWDGLNYKKEDKVKYWKIKPYET